MLISCLGYVVRLKNVPSFLLRHFSWLNVLKWAHSMLGRWISNRPPAFQNHVMQNGKVHYSYYRLVLGIICVCDRECACNKRAFSSWTCQQKATETHTHTLFNALKFIAQTKCKSIILSLIEHNRSGRSDRVEYVSMGKHWWIELVHSLARVATLRANSGAWPYMVHRHSWNDFHFGITSNRFRCT